MFIIIRSVLITIAYIFKGGKEGGGGGSQKRVHKQ